MTENEFLLEDRIAKIKATVEKYGEDNFYIAYSGGKDSTVLSYLVDIAVPGNTIPRVYSNTGIEYKLVLEFVKRERGCVFFDTPSPVFVYISCDLTSPQSSLFSRFSCG